MSHYRKLLLLIVIIVSLPMQADWLPFVVNYGRADYGNGATTWRIVSQGEWTFFANQRGMLVYDGVSWSCYQLNNRSEARSVAIFPNSQRVFIGGENEYGYFDIGPSGQLKYTCASELMGTDRRNVGNVFDIYEQNGNYYLRGDNYILVTSPEGKIKHMLHSPDKIFCSTLSQGTIYVATTRGVKMMAGNRLLPLPGGEQLDGKRMNGIFGFGKGLMIATDTEGFFYYDGHGVTPYPTPADNLLKQGVVCRAEYQNGKIAVGTTHQGLVVIDVRTGSVQQYDEQRGLQSNTVLALAFDERGNLWAGLDYGIDYIMLEDPFTYLYRSPNSHGIGNAALLDGSYAYFATDRGLYWATWPVAFTGGRPHLQSVGGSPGGQAWAFHRHGSQLLCLHDGGIFVIKGTREERIMTDVQGTWSCIDVEGRPDELFIGLYDGVVVARRQPDGQWTSMGRIDGIDVSGRFLRQSGPNELRVYNPNLGTALVYTLTDNHLKVTHRQQVKEAFKPKEADTALPQFSYWEPTGPVVDAGGCHIIPHVKGFVMYNPEKERDTAHRIVIRRMYATFPKDSILYYANFCGIKNEPTVSHQLNSIRLEFNVPAQPLSAAPRVQYRLNNGPWSEPANISTKEYSDLSADHYVFEVRMTSADGRIFTDQLAFTVLPPWYSTWQAKVVYGLLFALLLWLIVRLERARVRRSRQRLVDEKNRQMDQMQTEIDKLERDKLELDIRHKNQEIANMAINVARKNEMLTELKDRIKEVTNNLNRSTLSESKRELMLVMGSIDSNMEGDEVLRRFEEQFDLANDNFMQRLRERHPSLGDNERLMCAYLKMRLSSKEIAPLLGISVRGVETVRYRLRKKLGIERESNLKDYLDSL